MFPLPPPDMEVLAIKDLSSTFVIPLVEITYQGTSIALKDCLFDIGIRFYKHLRIIR